MPMVAELKEIDGHLWVRLEMEAGDGEVTMWTQAEIKAHKEASVRNFLIDLFQTWKGHQ